MTTQANPNFPSRVSLSLETTAFADVHLIDGNRLAETELQRILDKFNHIWCSHGDELLRRMETVFSKLDGAHNVTNKLYTNLSLVKSRIWTKCSQSETTLGVMKLKELNETLLNQLSDVEARMTDDEIEQRKIKDEMKTVRAQIRSLRNNAKLKMYKDVSRVHIIDWLPTKGSSVIALKAHFTEPFPDDCNDVFQMCVADLPSNSCPKLIANVNWLWEQIMGNSW